MVISILFDEKHFKTLHFALGNPAPGVTSAAAPTVTAQQPPQQQQQQQAQQQQQQQPAGGDANPKQYKPLVKHFDTSAGNYGFDLSKVKTEPGTQSSGAAFRYFFSLSFCEVLVLIMPS